MQKYEKEILDLSGVEMGSENFKKLQQVIENINVTYFVSDLHFGHKNIIKYCDRPFATVEDMNEVLIENWNKTVGKHENVFVLGDFAFGNHMEIIKWGRALNGNKKLILGNHDTASKTTYLDAGFKEVISYPIIWNNYMILSHEPQLMMNCAFYFNLFGHVHNDPSVKDISETGFCVSVERIGYKPISYGEIKNKYIEFKKGLE